ncbi:hypothetical protein [Methylocystis hirsuta]|uniref:hypothetical protein n=1 Tax=Methylocystis hirsuta TaxID=369798 RepID=UPI001FE1A6FD|nr:hypothetical protein [Methylocystis hirsuta]
MARRRRLARKLQPPSMRSAFPLGRSARRFPGFAGAIAAFLAAFVVYESLILAITAATGLGVDHFTAPVVSRIFFINLGAFAALLMLKAAGAAVANRDLTKALASRPI